MKTFQLINIKILLPLFLGLLLLTATENKVFAQEGFLNPDIDLAVANLAVQPDGKILISGGFNTVGGQPHGKVARLNANGTLDASFQNPNITGESGNDSVFALALQSDGKILIGGLFNSVGGQPRNHLARLNSDGSLDTGFIPAVNNTVTTIVIQTDGKILIGGYFTLAGGQSRNRVARLNSDGTLDTSFQDPNIGVVNNSPAYPIGSIAVQPDGKILIGGYFNSVGAQPRSGVARLNSDGSLDASFNLTIDGIAGQFVFQTDGKILLNGLFRVVNGVARTSIARINPDGSLDESFQNVNIPSGAVGSFDVQSDGKIIVGGNFSEISGQERRSLARLNANGTFDSSFQDPNANFGGNFYSIGKILVQPDGKILIGGQFDTVGRQQRKNLVRLLSDGSLDLPPAQTLTVTKTADTNDGACNSDCSLREAVAAANASVEASQINFDASLFDVPQTITLTSGELIVADSHRLTISGRGANLVTISGNNQSRVFQINRDAVVTLSKLTITGGNGAGDFDSGNGGGIYVTPNGSNTTLTLDNVTVRNNQALAGGGIYISGTSAVNINNSTFTENTVTYNYGGGGIYLYLGSLNLANSVISNNVATFKPSSGGGIAIGNSSAAFTLTNSSVTGNTADSAGGISAGGTGTISGSTISNNRSNRSAGGLYSGGTLSLIDSTVSGNTVVDSDGSGGGIFNFGRLTVNNSTVTGNSATIGGGISTSGGLTATGLNLSGNTSSKDGAGIYINAGGTTALPVTLSNSVVGGNNASGFGGGIYNRELTNLVNTTVKNNSSSLGGAGIFNVFLNVGAATVNATNSTISGNTSNAAGGGIANQTGTVNLTNSTVSSNTARGVGGGISSNNSGKINLTNATVAFNTATLSTGGGVNNSGSSVTARNTIFASNITGNTSAASDFNGTLNSLGYNLIGTTTGTTIAGTTNVNLLNVNPLLVPLADNGGTTQTNALGPNSPAIDAGDPTNVPDTDQRGFARPADGDGDGAARTDIGAFEVRPIFVNNVNDSGAGSLRQSLLDASLQADAVILNPVVFNTPQIITLTSGELVVPPNANLTINGGSADRLIISGNNRSRVLFVSSGAKVTIGGVTITGGQGSASANYGGGIYNNGTLTVFNSIISGNSAVTLGGGIFNNFGSIINITNTVISNNSADTGGGIYNLNLVNVTNSTISGNKTGTDGSGGGVYNNSSSFLTVSDTSISNNTADYKGGGICSLGDVNMKNSTVSDNIAKLGGGLGVDGSLTIVTSTVSGNTATALGGGIFNSRILSATNSTISGNSAISSFGGGIYNDFNGVITLNSVTVAKNRGAESGGISNISGVVNAGNTIIANNSANDAMAPDFGGTLNSQGFNLIENITGTTVTGTTSGNILGQSPQLLPLGNYGGTTQTHALRLSSPAIDKGGNFGVNTDQRGLMRPFDNPNIPNATGGNGADIGAFERQATESLRGSQQFDFDGDGKSDVSVYRPSNGVWYLLNSAAGFSAVQFGISTDKIVPADFDGDGKTDIAVFREGNWFLQRSTSGFASIPFGSPGDIPMPADFDGDGKAELAVYRPSNGTWYVLNLVNNQFNAVQFGVSEDKPVADDYDGDGRADYAVYRPSNGVWYLLQSTKGFTAVQFGISTDKPLVGDYDGDGRADEAVYRPENGTWYLFQSMKGFASIQFGIPTDLPTPADYDGDGKTDVAVFRPDTGNWYQMKSTQGFSAVQFGSPGDKPIPNAFIP